MINEFNKKESPILGLLGMGGGIARAYDQGGAVLTMSVRPSAQGGGSGEIGDGPFSVDSSTNLTVTGSDAAVRIRVAGQGGGTPGSGHYVEATITMYQDQTYHLYKNPQYAAVFYGSNATSAPVCIMLGAEGGRATPRSPGGNAGFPSGSGGTPLNGSGGGGGGSTSGYLSGSGGGGGGSGGNAPTDFRNPGTPGGLFSSGSGGPGLDGSGARGGMGYYGGGGGGGGWDYGTDNGGVFGGGGGGGSSYVGGLPGSAPYPAPVSSATSGSNDGPSYITFVSATPL